MPSRRAVTRPRRSRVRGHRHKPPRGERRESRLAEAWQPARRSVDSTTVWGAGPDARQSAVPSARHQRETTLSDARRPKHRPADAGRSRAQHAGAVDARIVFGRGGARASAPQGGMRGVHGRAAGAPTALLADLRLLLKRGRRARRNARRRARRRTDERVTAIRDSARTEPSVEPVAPTARVAILPVEHAMDATPVKAPKGAVQPKNATGVDDRRVASHWTKAAARGPRASEASAYQRYPEWLYRPDDPDGRLVMSADDAAALGPGWCDTPDPTVLANAAAVLRPHARAGRRAANDSSQSRSKKAAGQ